MSNIMRAFRAEFPSRAYQFGCCHTASLCVVRCIIRGNCKTGALLPGTNSRSAVCQDGITGGVLLKPLLRKLRSWQRLSPRRYAMCGRQSSRAPAPAAPPVQCENSYVIDLTSASGYGNASSLVFFACGTCQRSAMARRRMAFRGTLKLGALMCLILMA